MVKKIFIYISVLLLFTSCEKEDYKAITTILPFNQDIRSINIDGPFKVFISDDSSNEILINISKIMSEKVSFDINDEGVFYAKMNDILPSYSYDNDDVILEIYIPTTYLTEINLLTAASCQYFTSTPCNEDAVYTVSNASRLDFISNAVFLESFKLEVKNIGVISTLNKSSILVHKEFYFDASNNTDVNLEDLTVKGRSYFNLSDEAELEISGVSENSINFNELAMSGDAIFLGEKFKFPTLRYTGSENSFTETSVVNELSVMIENNAILRYKDEDNKLRIVSLVKLDNAVIEEIVKGE